METKIHFSTSEIRLREENERLNRLVQAQAAEIASLKEEEPKKKKGKK